MEKDMENSNKYYNNYERRLLQNVFRALCKDFLPKLALVLPLNADQTFVLFTPNHFFSHNAADLIHIPLNNVSNQPINKSIVRKHNHCKSLPDDLEISTIENIFIR